MVKLESIHDRVALIEQRLHDFLHHSLLPAASQRVNINDLHAFVKRHHLSLFDIHLSQGNKKLGKQPIIAELRIDLLHNPSKVHVFVHHYPAEHAILQILREQRHKFAQALGKQSIEFDFSHHKRFKQFVHVASTLKSASANTAQKLGQFMKTVYDLKDPIYHYAPLPKALKNFGIHAPQHTQITIEKKKTLGKEKVCIITIFNISDDTKKPAVKIELAPQLHDKLHALKPLMNQFYDAISHALGEDFSAEYFTRK